MTDTNHTDSVETIVERAVKSVTRDDDGLLDIGKHDHELLADLIREALQAQTSQQVEEAVRRVTDVIKANVPLERIPSDVQNTKELINEFMKLHYEPEHEEGQTCWCSPITTVEPTTKKAYIDHQEQRVILRRFIEDNFVSKEEAIASLCLGSNQARKGVLNAIKALTPNHQD